MTEGSLSLHNFPHEAGDVKMASPWGNSSVPLVPAEGLIPGFAAVISKDGSGSNSGRSKITMFFLHTNAFSGLYFHSQGVWPCESLKVWSTEGGGKTELSLYPGSCDTSLTSVCQLHTPVTLANPRPHTSLL